MGAVPADRQTDDPGLGGTDPGIADLPVCPSRRAYCRYPLQKVDLDSGPGLLLRLLCASGGAVRHTRPHSALLPAAVLHRLLTGIWKSGAGRAAASDRACLDP